MHPALMIDEILRLIFSFTPADDQTSLTVAARSCKAWRDPALDFLWRRLSTLKPLFLLLPSRCIINGELVWIFFRRSAINAHIAKFLADCLSKQEFLKFKSYARRIKHVNNRQELRVHPSAEFIASFKDVDNVLPLLSTAHISIPRCTAAMMPFYLSPNLIRLEIDIGFQASQPSMDTALCDYLERVSESCHSLQHVSLRGHASERLNHIVSRLTNLQTLSLKLGTTLLPSTLKAVTAFPYLSDLAVHAGHIGCDSLYDAQEEYTLLNAICKLHIRAQAAFIEHIVCHIPLNTLQHFSIELDDPSPCTTFWRACFTTIATKCRNTLTHLSLEHFFDLNETSLPIPSESGLPIAGSTVSLNATSTTLHIPFEVLELLRVLRHLRHFSCDITIPPTVTDRDIEKMVTWWPHLEHFELGFSVQCEALEAMYRPQITPSCLHLFARRLPKLYKLILPLAIDDTAVLPATVNELAPTASSLQMLTIAQLTTEAPSDVAHYLNMLFPFLTKLEGPCDDSKSWMETVDALQSRTH